MLVISDFELTICVTISPMATYNTAVAAKTVNHPKPSETTQKHPQPLKKFYKQPETTRN